LDVAQSIEGEGYVLCTPADESEWAEYHRIRRTALFEPFHPTVTYDPDHPEERKPNHHSLVLKKDGVVIGTIRVDLFDADRAAFRIIAIDLDHQRQGHGAALLRLAEAYARRAGRRRVVLHGNPANTAFYLRNGYVESKWHDDASMADAVDFAKDL
jgi:GNAT superfamily N-acetyltransferase